MNQKEFITALKVSESLLYGVGYKPLTRGALYILSMNQKSGIYQIQSKCNPKRIYIGSAVCLKERKSYHFWELSVQRHKNKKLQNHYNKYGKSDLIFSVLTGCEKEELIQMEQFFIDSLNPWFNICKTAGNVLGRKMSEETKRKIGIANKRHVRTEEQKNHLRIVNLGKKHSPETKIKMGNSGRGRKMSNETIRKIQDGRKWYKHSPETIERIASKTRGQKRTPTKCG